MCFFLSTNSTQAQILKKLKNKVKEVAEESILDKVGQKVDQETDRAMDSILDIDPDYEPKSLEKFQKLMGGSDIPISESYQFNTAIVYDMSVTSNNITTNMLYQMWFSGNKGYFGSSVRSMEKSKGKEIPEVFTVLDEENNAIIMVMEEQNMIQVMSMSSIKELAEDMAKEDPELISNESVAIKNTGNKKKILGYNCEEFITETSQGKTTFWITKELELYQKNMFYNLNKSIGGNNFKVPDAAQGVLLEMNFLGTDKNNKGDVTKMVAKEINPINKAIDISKYQRLNLGGLMQD